MSIFARFKLLLGILLAVLLVVGLYANLTYAMANVGSQTAQLQAQSYTVGTDYSGIVTKQYVQEGDKVTAGEPLFRIKSSLLQDDLTKGSINKNQLAFSINNQNEIVLKATGDGAVSQIDYLEGAFVPANKEIAAITKASSVYVEAKYQLAPPDYARLQIGDAVSVRLPNDERLRATVFDISVENDTDKVYTVIKARFIDGVDNLSSTFAAGTPVETKLHLSGKTAVDTIKEQARQLFQPKR